MPERRTPNLFLIGAPKCGTTALSHYLAEHPFIFMSERAGIKEPHFFNQDLALSHITDKIRDWNVYLSLFERAPQKARYLGEASSLYLYSKEAIPQILKCCDMPRFVVCLRNPVEIVQSLHNQHAKNGTETLEFQKAWQLQSDRMMGKFLPREFGDGDLLQYGEVATLGKQVRRLLTLVPRKSVHFIVYDDFAEKPSVCYRNMLEWLGLPDDHRSNFPKLNAHVGYRLERLEGWLRSLRNIRERAGLPGGLGAHRIINRFNAVNRKRQIPDALREELRDYFRVDVALLGAQIDRNLSHWLE